MNRPLYEALKTAEAELEKSTHCDEWCEKSADCCKTCTLDAGLEEAVDHAREALAESDEPREWDISEEGYEFATVTAGSLKEARRLARNEATHDPSDYGDPDETIWVDIQVWCEATDESGTITLEIDPNEPECDHEDGHDWQSPYEILGGCEENPGVWGNGGGVIIHTVCMHCGCERIRDTWAQRPDTGEQGLTSVSYEIGKYSEELENSQE